MTYPTGSTWKTRNPSIFFQILVFVNKNQNVRYQILREHFQEGVNVFWSDLNDAKIEMLMFWLTLF